MEMGVCYDQLNGGDILYKDTSDHLVYFVSGGTVGPVEIYWGKWSGVTVTENIVKSNFNIATGIVGLLSGRTYVFPTTTQQQFLYWLIPLDPTGVTNREIYYVKCPDFPGITSMKQEVSGNYIYSQTVPTTMAIVKYAKLQISGVWYRVYRSNLPYATSAYNTELIYTII